MFVLKLVANKNVQNIANFQQKRCIPRWSSRTPKKVYLPGEIENEVDIEQISNEDRVTSSNKFEVPLSFSFNSKQSVSQQKVPTLRKMKKQSTTTDMLETIIDCDGNLVYTKMNDNDSRVA